MKTSDYDEYSDGCVDSALDTLMRAQEIQSDDKMMGLLKKKLSSKKQAIESIEELKAVAQKKMTEPEGDDDNEGNQGTT